MDTPVEYRHFPNAFLEIDTSQFFTFICFRYKYIFMVLHSRRFINFILILHEIIYILKLVAYCPHLLGNATISSTK